MSTPRLVSPMLDGFQLNETISCRTGTACYTVTEQHSGNTFALKIASVPTSDVQMDALLMTGAFANITDANIYFKEEARAILNEAKTLRHMATLGGFTDFDCVQVVHADNGCGFKVYMLSPLRESITQSLQKKDLTNLEVLNMGLDLCSALSTCRHAGYLYANLKPENVFRFGQHYRIGDLGFLPMSSMGKTTIPEKYRSRYTAPELLDGTLPVNETADVYALGMILYQAYNGGQLPCRQDIIGRLYAPPQYADYEMAQIILRACAPDPSIRWKDPEHMGRALTHYLQRNGMRSTPIIPPILQELANDNPQQPETFLPEYPEEEPILPPAEAPIRRLRLQRKRHKKPHKEHRAFTFPKLSKGMVLISILAVVLIIELILGILVLGNNSKLDVTGFYAQSTTQDTAVTLVVSFEGKSPEHWIVTYSCDNHNPQTQSFTGTEVTISNYCREKNIPFPSPHPTDKL